MPSMQTTTIFGLLATAVNVAAHGFVDTVKVDGTSFTGYDMKSYPYIASPPKSIGWSETSTDLGFVSPTQYTTGDIVCHNGAKNAAISAPCKAGANIDLHWNTWPDSHHGPVINYLANCGGDCATVDKATLKWFKISQSGLLDNTANPGKWASDALMANNLTGSVTIPSSIAPGNYVLRHEIIALHSAGQENGAQNYPFCINLQVTGSGTDTPEGVLGTSLYTPTDAGIKVDIYSPGLTYKIPGPPLFAGGSGSGSGTPAPASSSAAGSAPAASSTSAPPSTMAHLVTSAVPTTFATSVIPTTAPSAPTGSNGSNGSGIKAGEADDTCE